jgi:3-(3-hydroxy-phenyl)propionate hydroxylase
MGSQMETQQGPNKIDVIIVGGGPTGLTLALALGREGRRVLLLEKKPGLSERSKAPAIWPRTQEILQRLDVLDEFFKRGLRRPKVRIWDSNRQKVLLTLDFDAIRKRTTCPQLLVLEQAETERILFEKLRPFANVEVRFEAEVTAIAEAIDGVRVQYIYQGAPCTDTAQFLAGCDGAHSKVRECLGFHLQGFTYLFQISLVDVVLNVSGDEYPFRISTEQGVAITVNIGKDLWRLILPFTESRRLTTDVAVARLFGRQSFQEIWASDFHIHNRVSDGFVKGRVAIAGDAAHLNSPVGGQGMNAGIQDADALASILLEALECGDPALLGRYEEKRRKTVRGKVNRFTHILTRLLLSNEGSSTKGVLRIVGLLCRFSAFHRFLVGRMAML